MRFSSERLKRLAGFTWKKGFLIIAFFLLASVLNAFIAIDWVFIVFAWPFYLLPTHEVLAAALEWLYAYAIATLLLLVLDRPRKKK